mmetsp:Transcript_30295/g.93476  ORF Transcript_30295/g.93476 Transcript_30295/m.93476 type:complete len:266 (-) Transcript_30295:193-990(-)
MALPASRRRQRQPESRWLPRRYSPRRRRRSLRGSSARRVWRGAGSGWSRRPCWSTRSSSPSFPSSAPAKAVTARRKTRLPRFSRPPRFGRACWCSSFRPPPPAFCGCTCRHPRPRTQTRPRYLVALHQTPPSNNRRRSRRLTSPSHLLPRRQRTRPLIERSVLLAGRSTPAPRWPCPRRTLFQASPPPPPPSRTAGRTRALPGPASRFPPHSSRSKRSRRAAASSPSVSSRLPSLPSPSCGATASAEREGQRRTRSCRGASCSKC